MRRPRATHPIAAAVGLFACLTLAGCLFGGDDAPQRPAAPVGVVLDGPARPAEFHRLGRAFAAERVPVTVAAAGDGGSSPLSQARRLLDAGARVLVVRNRDSSSGAPVERLARSRGVPVIDYGRLTLAGAADYYVGVDEVKTGELMGEGLTDCLRAAAIKHPRIVELNGPATDDLATQLKQGYDSVLNPYFTQERARKLGDESVPDWSPAAARRSFAAMLARAGGRIDGVLAASDALAGAVIASPARPSGELAVAGQGATAAGVARVRSGRQCVTVSRPAAKEAAAVAQLAGYLARGRKPPADLADGTSYDTVRKIPSVLVDPQAIAAPGTGD